MEEYEARMDAALKAYVWYKIWRDERGQDLIEYSLMVALVATGIGILMPATVAPAIGRQWSRLTSVVIRVDTN